MLRSSYMKKQMIAMFTAGLLLAPTTSHAFTFNPNFIISDSDLTNKNALDLTQIQQFLKKGFLGSYVTADHQGIQRTAADIIYHTAQNVGINPKFLIVLLQKEQSLIQSQSPTDKQLDWATGYAVCDDCSMNDPAIARWKGFGKQVNSAALQFVEGYLADIAKTGTTKGRYGPGVEVEISGQKIVPENAATAAMYAYTPHVHGNKLFVQIWNNWFKTYHPNGTLLKANDSSEIYLIQNGTKRHIKSWSVFTSNFSPDRIITVGANQLAIYPEGRPLDFPNYSLLEDEIGNIYLLVDDSLRKLESREAFRRIGFVEDEIVKVTSDQLIGYATGDVLTENTTHPTGSLFAVEGGLAYYVQDGKRHIVLDDAILEARFAGAKPQVVAPVVIEQFREGAPVQLPDGVLVKSADEATVYVISDGMKRAIPSESSFIAYGWSWDDILTLPHNVLKIHPTGSSLDEPEYEENN